MRRTKQPKKSAKEKVHQIIAKNSNHAIHNNQRIGVIIGYETKELYRVITELDEEFDVFLPDVIDIFKNWEDIQVGKIVNLIKQQI